MVSGMKPRECNKKTQLCGQTQYKDMILLNATTMMQCFGELWRNDTENEQLQTIINIVGEMSSEMRFVAFCSKYLKETANTANTSTVSGLKLEKKNP